MTTLRLACAVAAAAALAAPALAGKKIDSAYSDLTYEAEAEGITKDTVLDEILKQVAVA